MVLIDEQAHGGGADFRGFATERSGDSGGDVTTEGLRDSGTGGQESRTAADMPSDEQPSGNSSLPMSNNTDSAGQALNGGNNVIRIDAEEVIE